MKKFIKDVIIILVIITIISYGIVKWYETKFIEQKQNLINIINQDKTEFYGNKLVVKKYNILDDKFSNIGLISPKLNLEEKYGKHYISFNEIKKIDSKNNLLNLEEYNNINIGLNKNISIYPGKNNKITGTNNIEFLFNHKKYRLFFEDNNIKGQDEYILYIQDLTKKRFYINIIYDSIEDLSDDNRKYIRGAQIGLDGNIYFLIQNKKNEGNKEEMFHNEIYQYNIKSKNKKIVYSSDLPLININFKIGKDNIYIAGNMIKTFNMKYLFNMNRKQNYNVVENISGAIIIYNKSSKKEYLVNLFDDILPYLFFQ